MANLNSIDLAVVLFVSLSCIAGVRAGLLRGAFNVIGTMAGLAAAARYYPYGGSFLAARCGMPQEWADLASLVLFFLGASIMAVWLGNMAARLTRFRLVKMADRIGGGAAGAGMGALVAGTLLMILAAFPLSEVTEEVLQGSLLAPPLMDSASAIYEQIEARLPLHVPRLAFYPEELAGLGRTGAPRAVFKLIDFSSLDGATCFACGENVAFIGYRLNRYGTMSPKFSCRGCGRTSRRRPSSACGIRSWTPSADSKRTRA